MSRRSLIWAAADVRDGEHYRLLLCQSEDGLRYFRLDPQAIESDVAYPADVKLRTSIVPNELLRRRGFKEISDAVTLDSGGRFYVESHGIWLTETECKAFASGDLRNVEWFGWVAPRIPPR